MLNLDETWFKDAIFTRRRSNRSWIRMVTASAILPA